MKNAIYIIILFSIFALTGCGENYHTLGDSTINPPSIGLSNTLDSQPNLAEAKKTLDQIKKDLPQEQPPITFKEAWITKNVINNPEARISFQNTSTKTVNAVRIYIFCFDNFGNPTSSNSDNKFSAIKQDTIPPNGIVDGNKSGWTLYLHENTTKFTAVLAQVHFTDGTTWEPDNNPVMKIESK